MTNGEAVIAQLISDVANLRAQLDNANLVARHEAAVAEGLRAQLASARKALEAAKEFADDEFSDCGDLNRKNRILRLCEKIDAARSLTDDTGNSK